MRIASMVIATFACCDKPHVIGLGAGMPPADELARLVANEEQRAGKCSNVTVATMMHSECLQMCRDYVAHAEANPEPEPSMQLIVLDSPEALAELFKAMGIERDAEPGPAPTHAAPDTKQ